MNSYVQRVAGGKLLTIFTLRINVETKVELSWTKKAPSLEKDK